MERRRRRRPRFGLGDLGSLVVEPERMVLRMFTRAFLVLRRSPRRGFRLRERSFFFFLGCLVELFMVFCVSCLWRVCRGCVCCGCGCLLTKDDARAGDIVNDESHGINCANDELVIAELCDEEDDCPSSSSTTTNTLLVIAVVGVGVGVGGGIAYGIKSTPNKF